MDPQFSSRQMTILLSAVLLVGALQILVTWVGFSRINATLATIASATSRSVVSDRAETTASPVATSAAPGPRSDRDAQLDLRDRLINAFEPQKAAYRQQCFGPGNTAPRGYFIDIEIDAEGRETQRTIRPREGGDPRPEIDACVKSLKVAPLGLKPPVRAGTGSIAVLLP